MSGGGCLPPRPRTCICTDCGTTTEPTRHGGSVAVPQSVQMQSRDRDGRHSPPDMASAWTWSRFSSGPPHLAQRRARTLTPLPPRTAHQSQPCPTSRSFMAAPLQCHNQCRCRHSPPDMVSPRPWTGARFRSTRSGPCPGSTPPPYTVHQPQACATSRSFMATQLLLTTTQCRCRCVVVAAGTLHSTWPLRPLLGVDRVGSRSRVMILDFASASHGAPATSLPHQSELHGDSVADHNHCRCRCVVAAAGTLHQTWPLHGHGPGQSCTVIWTGDEDLHARID